MVSTKCIVCPFSDGCSEKWNKEPNCVLYKEGPLATIVPETKKPTRKITIVMPNQDTCIGQCTICPAEVLRTSWIMKIGTTIEFCSFQRLVSDVRITDDYIYIDLD